MSLSCLILIIEKPQSLQAQDRTFSSLELTRMLISEWVRRDVNNSSPGLSVKSSITVKLRCLPINAPGCEIPEWMALASRLQRD